MPQSHAPSSTCNDQDTFTKHQQVYSEIQGNHRYTLNPVEGVDSHGENDSKAMGEFEDIQEAEINATLASMNLDGGYSTESESLTQSASTATQSDPLHILGQNVRNTCTVLKLEVDMALDAYRRSREVMQWHAVNVCRVNMEYIRALQAANRLGD